MRLAVECSLMLSPADLDDFGNVEERGLIDASSIKMTSYFGENSAGGSTAITAGMREEKQR